MNRQAKTSCGTGVSTRTSQSVRNARQTDPILNGSGVQSEKRTEEEDCGPRERRSRCPQENRLGLASRWSASLLIWCSETKDKTKTFQ
jgi:hypothetical protein